MLFPLSAAVYLASRLIGLVQFPIYFFCDEAVQGVRAIELVRDGFRGSFGQLLPTYFQNGGFFNLSVTVYAQVLPSVLFGPSVFATRAVSVLIGAIGVLAAGLTLHEVFGLRFPWLGVLLLGLTPAWFLHSRTAFETAIATAFYACFLYFYLRYLRGRARSLYAAILFGALAFYTYSPMQLVIPATATLLFFSDFRHHLRNRRTVALGLLLAALLAVPEVRAERSHPDSRREHLARLYSYWSAANLTTPEKVGRYAREYGAAVSPRFWYAPENPRDLVRHRMKGYGNILPATLPFLVIGVVVCLRRWRSGPHRALLLVLLAAPTGGALAQVTVTRVLVLIVPAALLTAIGLEATVSAVFRRIRERTLALTIFLLLSAGQLAMLGDALRHGPTWYRDYGLWGMQWGAREVFGEVEELLRADASLRSVVSPNWMNGAEEVAHFFLPKEKRVELHDMRWFTSEKRDIGGGLVVVLPSEEYRKVRVDPRFLLAPARPPLALPDGSDGFHFFRLRYAPNYDALAAAERDERHALVRDEVAVGGEKVEVAHSRLALGTIAEIFDAAPESLVRSDRANPAVIEVRFPSPRVLDGVTITTGSMDFCLTARVAGRGGAPASVYAADFWGLPSDPTVYLPFRPPAGAARSIRIEIENLRSGDEEDIHVRKIRFDSPPP